MKSITVNYVGDSREVLNVDFPETSYTVNFGETFDAPKLPATEGITYTYDSSNTNVATVDAATGDVTIGTIAGKATITASWEANETYKAGSASYLLIVKDPNVKNYTLITSLDEIGDEANVVIACNTNNAAMGAFSSKYFASANATFYENNTELEPNDDFVVVKVKKNGTVYNYSIVGGDNDGKYIDGSTKTDLSLVDTAPKNGGLTFDEKGNAQIVLSGNTRYIQYNSGTPRFAYYSSTQTQTPVQLYLVEKIQTVEPAAPEVKFDYEGGYSEKVEDNGHTTITVAASTVVKITPVNEGDTVYYSLMDSSDAPAADSYQAYPADGLNFSVGAILYLYTESADGVKSAIEWYAVVVDNKVAVSELNAEAGEAEFFTLQGVRVANPENGLFIKVQNGKAAKVLVK